MKEINQKQMRLEVVIVMVVLQLSQTILSAEAAGRIAMPGCRDRCGNTSIPYPFGMGHRYCYYNPWFEVDCNEESELSLKKLAKYDGNDSNFGEWFGSRIISFEQQHRTVIVPTVCFGVDANGSDAKFNFLDEDYGYASRTHNLTGSPFVFSSKWNVLRVSGCGSAAVMVDRHNHTLAGCAAICIDGSEPGIDCHGVGCCQTTISRSVDYYNYNLSAMAKKDANVTTWAVLVNRNWIKNQNKVLGSLHNYQVVLQWTLSNLPVHLPSYANSSCVNKTATAHDAGGVVCSCKNEFYQGNPYVPYGCQVVKECESCVQDCTHLRNNTFVCPEKEKHTRKARIISVVVGLGLSIGSMLAGLGAYWIYHLMKRRRNLRLKAKHFERNGGLLLKQKLSSTEDNEIKKIKIFCSDELDKATDQYSEDRILGRGAQGAVYKGMLNDGKIVAIKKSESVTESRLNGFINEVVLLSQINHRNIVNLLGYCLESEVPILVYEYVSCGTLSQHIHAPNQDFPIAWEMRLQIATDVANALAYLHSSYFVPIFHRDIKSCNILLDEKYRAKLSDFGISKGVTIDQTHVTTTNVVGTFGYLDPEYFMSHQFTDKSDVYSYGVVLVELLTGQKAIRSEKDERGLVAWFVGHIKDSQLYETLDARVVREGRQEEIMVVAQLAKRCLNFDGKRRPTMKEVAAELETVRSSLQNGLTKNQSFSSIELDESPFHCIDIT